MKFYTGVGSRKTPKVILDRMQQIAFKLRHLGYTLRSGGAQGADSAFELGAGLEKKIFYAKDATNAAMEIARKHHPAWERCSHYAKRLHARNAFQVLGLDLRTPSKFLVCWTPDACTGSWVRSIKTGGTGTAISIAEDYGVEVFNLANEEHLRRLSNF
jgi:hypothetical protein